VYIRYRPKFGFGFGYGAETDLTYDFGLVSAMAKVHWHKFGFSRNITPKRRNCKIGVNCNTGSLGVRLLAVAEQGVACASWYRRQKLHSAAFHPSSWSHSLLRRVVCHPGNPAPTYYWHHSPQEVVRSGVFVG